MNELIRMLKKIGKYDLIMLLILTIGSSFISFKYILPCDLGLIVAAFNLYLSGTIMFSALTKNKINFLMLISFILKVFTVSIVAVLLFTYNKFYVIAYIIGFISHFIPIILYGTTRNNNERK